MEKTDATRKKLKWRKGFLNDKRSNDNPITKLRGTPQGSGASPLRTCEILGIGKGQGPALLKFDFSKLEKEVKEGGDTTELLERFQNILAETGKEIKELREKHHESNRSNAKEKKSGNTTTN